MIKKAIFLSFVLLGCLQASDNNTCQCGKDNLSVRDLIILSITELKIMGLQERLEEFKNSTSNKTQDQIEIEETLKNVFDELLQIAQDIREAKQAT